MYLVPGVYLVPGGVSGLGGSGPGRGVCSRGVSAPRGCGIPACTEADTPPVNRITYTCKNITLATTSLRPVKIREQAAKIIYQSLISKNSTHLSEQYLTDLAVSSLSIFPIILCLVSTNLYKVWTTVACVQQTVTRSTRRIRLK